MSKSLDMLVKAYKAVKLKAAPYVLAPVLAVLPMACGNGNNGSDGPLEKPSKEYVQPADGSIVKGAELPAGILEVGVRTPGANPDYSGTPADNVYVVVEVNGDGWVKTVIDSTATLDSFVTGDLDTNTADNGEPIEDGEQLNFHAEFTPQGSDDTTPEGLDWSVEYEGFDPNKPRVTGCYVRNCSVNASLSINCRGESNTGPITGWDLTGGPDGATIFSNGNILTQNPLEASDVGLHTYTVTCTDGTETSNPYTFTVPVDEHDSLLVLHCQGGNNENLLLPETSVDVIAEQCGNGFNHSLKPNSSSDPDYILDVDEACVPGAINGLTSEEREAHNNYNDGTTVDSVYSNCTVDFAQVQYMHN